MNIINSTQEVYSKQDYVAGEISLPAPRHEFWDYKQQFNQNKLDKRGCWYFAGTWALIDNYWQCDARKLLKEANKNKEKYWYTKGIGMKAYKAIDLVRHTWNRLNPNDPVISEQLPLLSNKFFEALDIGYTVSTWYRWNRQYNIDKSDGKLDWIEFGPATYGHMIRIVKKWDKFVVDNYYSWQHWRDDDNVYELADLKGLLRNDVYFNNGYIFIFKKDLHMNDQHKQDIKEVKYAIEKWLINDTDVLRKVKEWNYDHDVKRTLVASRLHIDLMKKL